MARVAPARRRSRSWLPVVLLLGVVGVLVLAPGPAQQVEAVGSRVLEPIQASVSGLFGQVEDVTTVVRRMTELSRQNDQYRDEIDRLQSEIAGLRELEVENRDLRNLLGLKQRTGHRRAAAGPGDRSRSVAVRAGDHARSRHGRWRQRGDDDHHLARRRRSGQPGQPDLVEGAADHRHELVDQRQGPEFESRVTGIIKGRPGGRRC